MGWGVLEGFLCIQPTRSRSYWKMLSPERLAKLMHTEGAGKEHPSRTFVASLIQKGESVLDAGCGAGANYEALLEADRVAGYVGVDSSEPSIQVAHELYPNGDFRVGNIMSLVHQFGEESFDVVIVRHVLEHLPDFQKAMAESISVSRKLAVFVFFLTPRRLPCGLRKVNPRIDPPYYTYIYSQSAIENFLEKSRLYYRWHYNVGASRTDWLVNETNSVLVVARNRS